MRATEKSYYNIKRLHLLFAAASLALLGVTLWMLAADHRRPWKQHQRTFQDRVEPWLTKARIEEQRASFDDDTELTAEQRSMLERLERTFEQQQPSLARRLLGLPLLDALSRTQAVDQIWLPDLTIDYNFRRVARFDRCVTCHRGIARTESELGPPQVLTLDLAAPPAQPEAQTEVWPGGLVATLRQAYGLVLSDQGILDPKTVTVGLVLPKSRAADARLQAGDVILQINDTEPHHRGHVNTHLYPGDVYTHLLREAEWGTTVKLSVLRGLPNPYCSHPRSDLFAGSTSPHPAADFGCTICHDGQGSATDFAWASHTPDDPAQRSRWRKQHGWFGNPHWDFPMLPKRFAQSRCLKCHHEVTDLEPSRRFPDPPAEKLLAGYNLVRRSGCFGCHEIRGYDNDGRSIGPDMRLEPGDRSTADCNGPYPGTMRKIGPDLRLAGTKLGQEFLADWVADPTNYLPQTRMPRQFGLHEHLEGRALEDARRFEAVEIRSVLAYLSAEAQPVEPLPAPGNVTEEPSTERGKDQFAIHGCLACHRHDAFAQGKAEQGPDLSNLAAKYTTKTGTDWLLGWIRNPIHLSPRTVMPDALLEPVSWKDEDGDERTSDPAADIAAFLLGSAVGEGDSPSFPAENWGQSPGKLPAGDQADLDRLALMYLSKSFPKDEAEKYLSEGIPQSMAERLPPDDAMLVGRMTAEKKRLYVGRRTIRRLGCYGCHDIPGFADAQPIGVALSEWGRKQESQLAFEKINEYILQSNEADRAADDPDRGFFIAALLAHRREGFLWQKLRRPRSFDFQTAAGKDYNQHLAMGRFNFTQQQIEAIGTFVLGLVADPPSEKYVYRPGGARKAIAEGRKILDRYACAECHTLRMERWAFEFDPDEFFDPPEQPEWDFMQPRISPRQIAASLQTDNRGLARAEVTGRPRVDADGQLIEDEDDDGNPLYFFNLWEPVAINGQVWPAGGAEVMVSQPQLVAKRAPQGGAFARLLYPLVLERARKSGSSASEREAWGWVPPPLVGEGSKVRPEWLQDYLLRPTVVRPAAVLKMPRYSMTAAESARLAACFVADAEEDPVSAAFSPTAIEPIDDRQSERLDDAMKLLADSNTYCAKCHLIGDVGPGGEIRTILAPRLERAGRRLQPAYLHRWLANPKVFLPYTAMPVNFPPSGDPLDRGLFDAGSREQLDAVTILLLNYDAYLSRRTSVRSLVEPGGER